MRTFLPLEVEGHCRIVDDLGVIHLDKHNAVHPQNLARVFARSLANEHNYYIYRMAFGNGGTTVDAAFTITYKTPNDGQPPDLNTWDSRIYHETYSEIVDAGQVTLNPLLGTDPGSADLNTGDRPGGGAVPADDPPSIPHVSGPGVRSAELGLTSEVVITCVLNQAEPLSQDSTDSLPPTSSTEAEFVFDEIGLYTSGAPAIATSGYQYINVGTRNSENDSGLLPGTGYSFSIQIDGGSITPILFTTPVAGGSGSGGEILYGDLCEAINTGDVLWGLTGVNPLPGSATMSITDNTGGTFPSITGAETYGFLRIESPTAGVGSAVNISLAAAFLAALNPPSGATLETPIAGEAAGVQNNPVAYQTERERLLAHLIFSPVLKSANRVLTITYTLTISVARTPLITT
jgi:hypothetical protein